MTQPTSSIARMGYVAAAADAQRQQALEALTKLPPFSPILSKLMASLAGADVSFLLLGELIEKDAVVAANILRVVNSAVYARRGEVNSVRHALAVLGLEKVRNTVLAMSISRMLNGAKTPAGWSMKAFNQHAAAVAILSDLLAQKVKVNYPEGAFVAGLLHDVGRLLVAMGLPREYAALLAEHRASGKAWFLCERERLGFDHAELAAQAMQEWNLPEPIREAIGQHHAGLWTAPGQTAPLALVVQAADRYVNGLGQSIVPGPEPECGAEALEALGLGPEPAAAVLKQFHAEHDAMVQYYQ